MSELPYGKGNKVTSKEYWAFRTEAYGLTHHQYLVSEAMKRVTIEDLGERALVDALHLVLADKTNPIIHQGLNDYMGQLTEAGVVRLLNGIRKAVTG